MLRRATGVPSPWGRQALCAVPGNVPVGTGDARAPTSWLHPRPGPHAGGSLYSGHGPRHVPRGPESSVGRRRHLLAVGHVPGRRHRGIVEVFVLVHPDLCCPARVAGNAESHERLRQPAWGPPLGGRASWARGANQTHGPQRAQTTGAGVRVRVTARQAPRGRAGVADEGPVPPAMTRCVLTGSQGAAHGAGPTALAPQPCSPRMGARPSARHGSVTGMPAAWAPPAVRAAGRVSTPHGSHTLAARAMRTATQGHDPWNKPPPTAWWVRGPHARRRPLSLPALLLKQLWGGGTDTGGSPRPGRSSGTHTGRGPLPP